MYVKNLVIYFQVIGLW